MNGLPIVSASVFALVAKATLIVSVALVLAWFNRRSSARTLHLLWTATFLALFALPGLSLLAPSWELPILPVRSMPASVQTEHRVPEGMPGDPPPAAVADFRFAEFPSVPASPSPAANRPSSARGDAPIPQTAAGTLFLLWALGCGAGLVSLGVGGLRFRSLVRRATPVDHPAWIQSARRLRRRLRVRTRARLLFSARIPAPMTGGLFRPVVLLPASATAWTVCRREAVLSHELVHLRRRDTMRQVVGCVVVALYWFHPLCWIASRLAAAARERSCDEEVLELGVRPSDYARHLLALAFGLARRPPALSLPMAERSHLEERIRLILKSHRPHYSRLHTLATLATLAGAGILLACARPVPVDPLPGPATPAEVTPVEEDPAASLAPSQSPPPEPTPPPEYTLAEPLAAVPPVWASPEPEAPGPRENDCKPGAFVGTLRDRESTTLQVSVEGMSLCMRTRGNVSMTEDGTAVASMDAGSRVLLQSQAERRHRLEITHSGDGPVYAWSIDGRPTPFDDEAREWRKLMFTVVAGFGEAWQVRGREAGLRREIGSHERQVAGLRREAASHERQVASVRRKMASHERRVAGMRREIASHERQVADLDRIAGLARVETQEASQEGRRLRAALAAVESGLRTLHRAIEDYDLEQQVREVGRRIDEYDLDGKTREIEMQIERYDQDGKIRDLEARIEGYNLDASLREIETRIDEYDLDGKIQAIEMRIEELDADRRAEGIEESIQDEIAALRTLIG